MRRWIFLAWAFLLAPLVGLLFGLAFALFSLVEPALVFAGGVLLSRPRREVVVVTLLSVAWTILLVVLVLVVAFSNGGFD